MQTAVQTDQVHSPDPLARMRAFCFPEGEHRARAIRGVRTKQRGQIRSAPNAAWIRFTAEETMDAATCRFRWYARMGGLRAFTVTDAFDDGHGFLTVKLGGLVTVQDARGPEIDAGELQRYLGSVAACSPMLLHNQEVTWTVSGNETIVASAGATQVTIDVDAGGALSLCRASRPRMVGKSTVLTPWTASASNFDRIDGIVTARRMEAAWHPPEGSFTYFAAEVTDLQWIR